MLKTSADRMVAMLIMASVNGGVREALLAPMMVLTGNGSDGADGVREISRMGGVVIAQDSATAEYAGLPQAAIDTGAVDYVLPLSSIASKPRDHRNGTVSKHLRYGLKQRIRR